MVSYTLRGLPDAYACWDIGDVVVDYMSKHGGRWPSEWEDLRPSYNALALTDGRMRGGLTFDDLRNRIEINWSASPEGALSRHVAFKAIVVKSGNGTRWAGAEPNDMVIDYLRRRNEASASRPVNGKS
jgi:hypothetical protein